MLLPGYGASFSVEKLKDCSEVGFLSIGWFRVCEFGSLCFLSIYRPQISWVCQCCISSSVRFIYLVSGNIAGSKFLEDWRLVQVFFLE